MTAPGTADGYRLAVVATTTDGSSEPFRQAAPEARYVLVLADADGEPHEVRAGQRAGGQAVAPGKRRAVAALLDRLLVGPHVAVATDRVAEGALWDLARHRDDLLAVATVDAARRVLALLAVGRSAAGLRDVSRGLVDLVPGGGRTAVRVVRGTRLDHSRLMPHRPWLQPGRSGLVVRPAQTWPAETAVLLDLLRREKAEHPPDSPALVVGPANPSGQGYALARAIAEHSGWTAVSIDVHAPGDPIQRADVPVPQDDWQRPSVRMQLAARAVVPASYVLFDAVRPLLAVDDPGTADPASVDAWRYDVDAIRRSGRGVGLVVGPHDPHAPSAKALARVARDVPGPVYCRVPWLCAALPHASWLPPVAPRWAFRLAASPPLVGDRPVVVLAGAATHDGPAPEEGADGGAADALAALAADGHITLRGTDGVPPLVLPSVLAGADVVVEAEPGEVAVAALAAGRLVVSRRGDDLPDAPVVADDDLAAVVRDVVANPDRYRDRALAGAAYARETLDGRRTAEQVTSGW